VSYLRIVGTGRTAPDRSADRQLGLIPTACATFRRFHHFPGPCIIRRPCRRIIPKVLVHLGSLRGLIYRSDRGDPGRPKTYIHFMDTPPQLVCDPRGTQLYIIGGRYRVTRRGIEG
jgi:hypothetical protein